MSAPARPAAAAANGAGAREPAAARPLRGAKLALLTFALSLATFIEVLDSTVANVAVPAISGSLGVSNSQGTWVISSYSVAAAIAVPLTGWLARRVGEQRLFVASVILFTLTSLLCGLARDLEVLVACRALQGLFSGPMVPLSQTILMRAFAPAKRTLALALWGMTVLLAPIFGPVVGGWLIDNFSWPWIFLINLPIGLFSFAVCTLMLRPRASRGEASPIDVPGIVLLVIGVGSLQAMLDLGHDRGWFDSSLITALAIAAGVSLVSLLIWELGEAHPVVELSLFRERTFTFCVVIISLGMMSFSVVGVVFPLWLQAVMGYTAYQAGLATASMGLLALVFSILVGVYASRVDARVLVTFGFGVFAAVMGWSTHFTLSMTFAQVVTPRLIQGMGLPCFFIPLTAATLSRVADDKLAAASSLSNFLRTLSAAFGTALSVTWWDNRATYHYAVVSQAVTRASENTQRYVDALHAMGLHGARELSSLHQVVRQQAYMMATNDMFYMASVTCVLLAGLMWLTRPKRGAAATMGH
ncbi:DHA2 family efflux MFS transporter permease subunit [Burkholderia pseudomallei]|uniref:DHA2 family efflux MFS transporter permease subunit n=4 Tax=Burkholderia pseudomallei TaxID=28450 RepID=UPI000A1A0654|nr:DHA2 family efflux MFS transporter permease subunit [Burkholderia pseudomallei]ARK58626.1 MFS transporter [Burkholderia pseudomallei]ARK60363.1 MFS transporter [Burkholderia pseudomallei]ARK90883.1 MFS transporter [Burkholderia pseudomallei]ARK92650.1 MFS transporter [Burkholderia pseudomallei]MBH9659412.1 DHA2 family efflux MFS transporter permease subunit [Burkholderia pseudomallei]